MPKRGTWKVLSCGLVQLLSIKRGYPMGAGQPGTSQADASREGASQISPRILAIVPTGLNRVLLEAESREAGWSLTLSETPDSLVSQAEGGVPPIVIYDREIHPCHWREIVAGLTKISPRPYVILLSPTADSNLWDELQRLGGSDMVRKPVNRDAIIRAVKLAWRFTHNRERIQYPSPGFSGR